MAVIILCRNEAKNIVACIQSAAFADETVVIDSGSTDGTQELARENGAKVIDRPMDENGFAGQRNFALTQTNAEWVFYLDADERILPPAAKEIRDIVAKNEMTACRVKRLNIVFGQLMRFGGHGPDYVTRLFPRKNVTWRGVVHESPQTDLPVKTLKGALEHYTYTDWERYFEKFNSYTTLMAKRMGEEGRRVSFLHIIFRPLYAFFRFYVLQLGFLDGKQGFIFASTHLFYTMIKYVKRYYAQKEEQKQCVLP